MHKSRIIRNIRLGINTLMLHKLRSSLTVLGVVFGVGSVIAMLAVGEGAGHEAIKQIQKLGSNNIIITSAKPTSDEQAGMQQSFMSIYGLLYDDELRIKETIPGVRATVPVKQIRSEGRLGERTLEMRLMGTTPDWFTLVNRPLLAGRTLIAQDMQIWSPVCVLTEQGARRLLAMQHSIGQVINIGGNAYKVVGIVSSEESEGSIQTPDQQIDAYIPLNVAQAQYGDISARFTAGVREREFVELHMILVETHATEDVEKTAATIEAMLQTFHRRQDYNINVPLALLRQAERTKHTFNIVLGSIAGISLLVGGIGIMNIMLASVTERTREIGIRRAIGAKQSNIVGQFLIETSVLSMVGGLGGIALGYIIPWLITRFTGMPSIVPTYSIVLSIVISLGIGLIFGIYPARRAASLDPITALRYE